MLTSILSLCSSRTKIFFISPMSQMPKWDTQNTGSRCIKLGTFDETNDA